MSPLLMLNLTVPLPDPLPQPAPTLLLWGLLLLTFFLHLVPMNLALGGSLLGVVARLRGRGNRDPHARTLTAWFAKALPTIMAATISFGVAPLLFVQVLYGRALFGSSVIMAWWWLSVVGLVIVAYYGAYRLAFRAASDTASQAVLALSVAAILVLVAFIYTNNMSLMLRVGEFPMMTLDGTSGWLLNLDDRALVPRYLHMLLGATGVAGAATALLGWMRCASDPAFGRWAMRYGSGWAAVASFVNAIVGSWWLMSLPRDVLWRLAGRDAGATVVLMIGVSLGLVTVMAFALASRAADPIPAVRVGLATLLATLPAMIFTRDQVRESAFIAAGLGEAARVEPQWMPIVIFVVLLLAAVGTIGWMLRALVRGPSPRHGDR